MAGHARAAGRRRAVAGRGTRGVRPARGRAVARTVGRCCSAGPRAGAGRGLNLCRTGSNGYPFSHECLSELRRCGPGGASVLRPVRGRDRGELPVLRRGDSRRPPVLRPLRRDGDSGHGGAGCSPDGDGDSRDRASARFRALCDLVGFTTLSESRDAEEVRALLSRYFDTCRRLIELYGGTVEKFIGDARDGRLGHADGDRRRCRARRSCRARPGRCRLSARPGGRGRGFAGACRRLDGEAAVTIGATGQGMVAGDVVNTASRLQSVAEPGSVVVGEATRRATEQAIVYEDAGSFELKGKEAEAQLWKALRVVSGVRGTSSRRGWRRRSSAATVSCARSRISSHLRRGGEGAPGLGDWDRRDREVAAGLGVLQVLRRDRADRLLAPRPLPRLRRGRHLLGAGGHGAECAA